jgi:rhodanese-related sulfurtransferase
MNFKPIYSILITLLLSTPGFSQTTSTAPVYITPGVLEIELHDKETNRLIILKRNQSRENEIDYKYSTTHKGKIQRMNPFFPNRVDTIGELEIIDYLKMISSGDEDIVVIDTRKKSWFDINGHIPLSINVPAKVFKSTRETLDLFEERFGVLINDELLDYTYAKTLVMYCNGPWCGKTPSAIKKLISYGYPPHKLKYYRGGMQMWKSLGLTVMSIYGERN